MLEDRLARWTLLDFLNAVAERCEAETIGDSLGAGDGV